jgi:endonuclease-3
MPSRNLNLHDPSRTTLKLTVGRIARLLEKTYGRPQKETPGDPLDTLILTILSQNTNDRNRDRAYDALKATFPHWEDVLRSNRRRLVRAIRPGGLAEQKAGRIREILRWVKGYFGGFSLSALHKMDSETIQEIFGGLKGVGPKTVHCLLLFGLGREAFPVDTHVLRVGTRLGFIPARMSAEEAHRWMSPLVPNGESHSLHINLIRLGRSFCRAKNPRCPDCFLKKECLHFRQSSPRKRSQESRIEKCKVKNKNKNEK